MNGRFLWFAAGTVAGVYSTLKARRAAYRLTPPGLADQANALMLGAREFSAEVHDGMRARHYELAAQLDLLDPQSAVPGLNAAPLDATDKEYR